MGETGITVRLQTVGEQSLPLPVEAELYAIAKEALMNIDHHANAAEATVLLVRRPKLVRLTVQDNGSGFDTYAEPNGGHGLLGMRERARLLGGSLRIVSSRKRGTTVSVAVPLNLPDEVVGSE
jgi:signal transduction histidine kinase